MRLFSVYSGFSLGRFSVYSGFSLDRFSVYSGFSLGRFSVYSGFSLGRFLVYSGFSLGRFSVYSGFSLDRFHSINIIEFGLFQNSLCQIWRHFIMFHFLLPKVFEPRAHWWCNDLYVHLECDRSWVGALVGTKRRL
jgi:hypothetical protein